MFGSPLPAAKLSVCRGRDDRAGEQDTNLLESAQNLSSEEPAGSESIQFNCMLGERKSCLPWF